MNIVMVSGHACIRVQKMMLALIERGHKVHLIAKGVPQYFEYYSTFCNTIGTNHYADAIDIYAKTADVFHVHNEPSWFVSAIKERCDVPVVLDIHDSFLTRTTPEEQLELTKDGTAQSRIYTEERNNFQIADALVFPAKHFADIVRRDFNLKQGHIILPSMVPKMLYQYNTKEWMGGLVYEGRVDLKSSIESSNRQYGYRYCEYSDLAKQANDIGIDFHIYSTKCDKDEFSETYGDISFPHKAKPFDELLPAISRHDWGLVGNINKTPEWDVALPNKLFEYVASNVPVVVINAQNCADFVLEYGVGIVVKDLYELADRWAEHEQIRANLIKVRQRLSMDAHIHILEDLYKDAVDAELLG